MDADVASFSFFQVEELLQEEALTQELVMQEKDRGRISLEEQLEQARAAVQALKVRFFEVLSVSWLLKGG